MFGFFKKKPTVAMQAKPVAIDPSEVEKRERVKQRIKRIKDYMPQVPKERRGEYEAELRKLEAVLVVSGMDK